MKIPDLFFILALSFVLGSWLEENSLILFILLSFFFPIALFFWFKNFSPLKKIIKICILIFFLSWSGFWYSSLRTKTDFSFVSLDKNLFLKYRLFVESKIKEHLTFQEGNLLKGIILGGKFEDQELKNKLTLSGLSHITAISGHNLTIILSLVFETLKIVGFFNPLLLFITINLFIFIFLLVMDFQGSVLRAGIMAFFLILAKNRWGRIVIKRNILILTLLIFVVISPKLLKDIGVQLSFLAMTGILYLSPIVERSLKFEKYSQETNFVFEFKRFLIKALSEIIGAQILVLPLVVYYFGNFNILSFLANLLIFPVLLILLPLGYLFLFFPLGKWFSWLSFPLLKFIIWTADIFSRWGIIYFKIPLSIILTIYFFIFYQLYLKYKNELPDFHLSFS